MSKNLKFIAKLKELGLKPEAVALDLDKSARTIHSWRSGQHTPKLTPKQASSLCQLLNISIQELAELFD